MMHGFYYTAAKAEAEYAYGGFFAYSHPVK